MKAAIIALLALAGASAASAQGVVPPTFNPRAPENSQVLGSFTYGSVEAVLDGIGAKHPRAGEAGKPAFLVSFPNTRHAVCMFGPCNDDGCAHNRLCIQSSRTQLSQPPPRTESDRD